MIVFTNYYSPGGTAPAIHAPGHISQTAEELRLRWLRLRTNDKELVIAPGATCTLVLVHKAHAKEEEEGEEGDGAD